jgi:hypothetical protein
MKNQFRNATYALPALLVAVLAPSARAGCGDTRDLQAPFVFAPPSSNALAVAQRANDATRSAAESGAAFSAASIVGLWKIQFLSLGNTSHNPPIPDGAQIDFGYTQWHSDGTELMNSGGHAPATQNFCMGIWARTGFLTYELNHYALSYDATTAMLSGKVDIREQITLDPSGNEFTGAFTIDVYDPTNGQKVDHVAGTIAAQRVTVDQTTP